MPWSGRLPSSFLIRALQKSRYPQQASHYLMMFLPSDRQFSTMKEEDLIRFEYLYLTIAPLITRNTNSKVIWTTSRRLRRHRQVSRPPRRQPKPEREIGSAWIATISTSLFARSAIDVRPKPESRTRLLLPSPITITRSSMFTYLSQQPISKRMLLIRQPLPTLRFSTFFRPLSRTKRTRPHPNMKRNFQASLLSSRNTTLEILSSLNRAKHHRVEVFGEWGTSHKGWVQVEEVTRGSVRRSRGAMSWSASSGGLCCDEW